MRHDLPMAAVGILLLPACWLGADETPVGKGLTEANQERLVLDDMQDISDWYNGSPEETAISASDRHAREGRPALLFANTVDHTRGERNYPIGWPRTGKDLARANLTDWSGYDFFECWIYAESSRERLPAKPLGVGFYHSGRKQSSSFPLNEVEKDAWSPVAIPLDQLADARDVQRLQFNISEADYRHGDRVDFYIDRPALVRYVEPAVVEFDLERKLLFASDGVLRAYYRLAGYRGLETTQVELTIFRSDVLQAAARTEATRQGELTLAIDGPLVPGGYSARLCLRDREGKLIDRKDLGFRVIAGPFEES